MIIIICLLPFFIVSRMSFGGAEQNYPILENDRHDEVRTERQEAAAIDRTSVPGGKLAKYTDYSIIAERNLFQSYLGEEETKPRGAENPLAGLETTSLDLVLMGTINASPEKSRAIIFDKKQNKQNIYHQGDTIEGAKVKDILRGKVILDYQGKEEILDMRAAKRPQAATAALGENIARGMSAPSSLPRRRVGPPGNSPQIPEHQEGP